MLKVDKDAKAGYLELTVDGVIHKADYEAAVAAVDELLKTHEQLNVVEVVRDIGWVEPQVWWKDLLFTLRTAISFTALRWLATTAGRPDADVRATSGGNPYLGLINWNMPAPGKNRGSRIGD
jgi:hypothetical protein